MHVIRYSPSAGGLLCAREVPSKTLCIIVGHTPRVPKSLGAKLQSWHKVLPGPKPPTPQNRVRNSLFQRYVPKNTSKQ